MPDSEFRAYDYIAQSLAGLGWDKRNPQRGGSVYVQGEFRKHDELLASALGLSTPENIIVFEWASKIYYWVVEAKNSTQSADNALLEAKDYAEKINQYLIANGESARSVLATGVAGSPDESIFVATVFWDGQTWKDVRINGYVVTGFISKNQCIEILENNSPDIGGYEVNLDEFLRKANQINATLYSNGVANRDRARIVAGLLLSLVQDSQMSLSHQPSVLVRDVNSRIEALLKHHSKLDFFDEVTLKLPATNENHHKYRRAIVSTLQYLREMNIRSAINSGTDALGQFYETFLKYANDANEMGIVLTPRHITKLAATVLGVSPTDTVYDPTCGTGGFLVAALDHVRANFSPNDRDGFAQFSNDNLYGIEQADNVFCLGLVNMIFRGDGSSHIHNGSCFDNRFVRDNGVITRISKTADVARPDLGPFTRVFMNPPFALQDKETTFVDHALQQTAPGARLFAILPNGPVTGEADKTWRKNLLRNHSLKAVIRMQDDLFYPQANKGTYAIIVETWRPHQLDDLVYFGVLFDDDSASQKSKLLGISEKQDNVQRVTSSLSRFIQLNQIDIEPLAREQFLSPIVLEGLVDFASEAYLPDGNEIEIDPEASVKGLMDVLQNIESPPSPRIISSQSFVSFSMHELFERPQRGRCKPARHLEKGPIPLITTKEVGNGIYGYFDLPEENTHQNCMTISANGSGGKAFLHPYKFGAVSDVLVCDLRPDFPDDPALKLFICEQINNSSWRYDYYRKGSLNRLTQDLRIRLPMVEDEIDVRKIVEELLDSSPSFSALHAKLLGLTVQ